MKEARVEITIPTNERYLDAVRSFFRRFIEEFPDLRLDEQDLSELELVIQEACVNAIRHASLPAGADSIALRLFVGEEALTIEVQDQGRGFDLASIPDPDPESLQEGGYGLFIIRRIMDTLSARPVEGGFVLTMKRSLAAAESPCEACTP